MHPILWAEDELIALFERKGYFRVPRHGFLGNNALEHRKDHEVCFVARNPAQLKTIRDLLLMAEFRPSKPYRRGAMWIQPVYGRVAFFRVQQLCEFALAESKTVERT